MAMTEAGVLASSPRAGRALTRRRSSRRRWFTDITLVGSAVWMGLMVVCALTVHWLPLHDYITPTGVVKGTGPNWSSEFLGTDSIGRSMLSRTLHGAQVSLAIGFVSTALGMTVGGVLGLASVYFRGVVSSVVDVLGNTVLAIPDLLFLLAIALALDPTVPVLVCALSIITVPRFIRLTRANALTQLNREYVIAARSMGASARRVMFKELLPNTILPVVSYALLVVPAMIFVEGSLSFLGFGVKAPRPSWGGMIAAGRPTLTTAPWEALTPCIVLFLTVFSLNRLGDYLRRRVDLRDRV